MHFCLLLLMHWISCSTFLSQMEVHPAVVSCFWFYFCILLFWVNYGHLRCRFYVCMHSVLLCTCTIQNQNEGVDYFCLNFEFSTIWIWLRHEFFMFSCCYDVINLIPHWILTSLSPLVTILRHGAAHAILWHSLVLNSLFEMTRFSLFACFK